MIIIGTKPFPLVQIVANPFTGDVNLVLNPEAGLLYGPAYIGIVKQQLEKALKVVEKVEENVY